MYGVVNVELIQFLLVIDLIGIQMMYLIQMRFGLSRHAAQNVLHIHGAITFSLMLLIIDALPMHLDALTQELIQVIYITTGTLIYMEQRNLAGPSNK
jgi:hypothetical protein